MPDLYQNRGADWSYGYNDLSELGFEQQNQRNQAAYSTLRALQGPSYVNPYAAGGTDAAAREYRDSRQARMAGLAGRGLLTSGAIPTAERGALRMYGGKVSDAYTQATTAESARQQSLRDYLQQIVQAEIASSGGHSDQQISDFALNQGLSNKDLADILGYAKTAFSVTAAAAGGAAGAYGGLGAAGGAAGSTGGAAGAAQGAAYGAGLWDRAGGGGGGSNPGSLPTAQNRTVQYPTLGAYGLQPSGQPGTYTDMYGSTYRSDVEAQLRAGTVY